MDSGVSLLVVWLGKGAAGHCKKEMDKGGFGIGGWRWGLVVCWVSCLQPFGTWKTRPDQDRRSQKQDIMEEKAS